MHARVSVLELLKAPAAERRVAPLRVGPATVLRRVVRARRPRLVVRGPTGRPVDVTREMVAAVAFALWQHTGGNDVVNWLEAERIIEGVVAKAARRSTRGAEAP